MTDRLPPRRITAAFDFDGTITRSDSFQAFVLATVGRTRFALAGVRTAPWLAAMAARVCDRGAAKARFLAATLGGMTREQLEAAAERFVAVRLPSLLRPEMLTLVEAHRQRGHQLLLVSASPSLYLDLWARQAGFDAVLATELEFRDDRFTGRLASPNCWGPEKVRRLQTWFGDQPVVLGYAYGDSRGDRELLALAEHPWLRGWSAELPFQS
jgi:phosphatidylglycerophosphatase C